MHVIPFLTLKWVRGDCLLLNCFHLPYYSLTTFAVIKGFFPLYLLKNLQGPNCEDGSALLEVKTNRKLSYTAALRANNLYIDDIYTKRLKIAVFIQPLSLKIIEDYSLTWVLSSTI